MTAFRWIDADGEEQLSGAELDRRLPGVFLGSLLPALRSKSRPRGTCPFCGTTAEMAEERQMLGCPLCYEALDTPLLRAIAAEATSSGAASLVNKVL